MNTFRQSRSSLDYCTRFQTKMDKVYTPFQTKTAQKPYPLGRHIHTLDYMAYIREYIPGGLVLAV